MTYRQKVLRPDGRSVHIVQKRGHLSYCYTGCCCGHTERGYAPVPAEVYKEEWLRRRLRNVVHLTKGGCLGPCTLANVAALVFDGRSVWFHSVNTPWQVRLIFDYIEAMLGADRFLPPPPELSEYAFDFYDWAARGTAGRAPEPLPGAQSEEGLSGLVLLTHADTDLLALEGAKRLLPPGFPPVSGLSLNRLKSSEQMALWLQGSLGQAQVVVLRLHGSPEGVPGLEALQAHVQRRGQRLLFLSGLGELPPELARRSTEEPWVLHEATRYLMAGGVDNLLELCKYLSDALLGSRYGYAPPTTQPEHGIYHPQLPQGATLEDWLRLMDSTRPTVGLLFYRAHYLSGNLAFVDALVEALEARGLNALPVYTTSLKALEEGFPVALRFMEGWIDVLISTLAFALGEVHNGAITPAGQGVGAFARLGVPVVQAIAAGMPKGAWEVSGRGLNPLETAMQVALPEFDGRIIGVPVSFKEPQAESLYTPEPDRLDRVAGLAARLAALRRKPNREKRIAIVLTNSGAKAKSVGGAVGLDTPASLLRLLRALRAQGYTLPELPESPEALMEALLRRGTYDPAHPLNPALAFRISRKDYLAWFRDFPEALRFRMEDFWGAPRERGYTLREGKLKTDKKTLSKGLKGLAALSLREEPYSDEESYWVAGLELGHVLIALQPPRGYGLDPDAIYHTPDLPPTHHYAAFYRWLEQGWGADAIVHLGKHGTLEWLPGKGVGLSAACAPDALLGDLPLIYPFILNDPGEGTQAKRRAHAVVVDHLPPPLTLAETYGPLARLSELVNEYYALEKLDPSKLPLLQQEIWQLLQETQLQADLELRRLLEADHGDHKHEWDETLTPEGVPTSLAEMEGRQVAHLLEDIEGYLCELGLAQIRDGLHILGQLPPFPETLRALTRLPNGGVPGWLEALARAYGFGLEELMEHKGRRLEPPHPLGQSHGQVLERLEQLALATYERLEREGFNPERIGAVLTALPPPLAEPRALEDLAQTLRFACLYLVPALERTDDEIEHVLLALEGGYVPAGPAGAPSRGQAHVLPSGRNFYAVDPRALPSQAAWRVGQRLAQEALERHLKETGRYPEMVALSAWGTAQMRTQGDEVAEVLAFLGVRPRWHPVSRRIEGLEVIPLEELGRPRIDVTLRISGFFRDAFPHLIELLDEAFERVMHLPEDLNLNYPRKHYLEALGQADCDRECGLEEAEAKARWRIFGSKPGSYGAGLLPLIEAGNWEGPADLAQVYLEWGGYAYGKDADGIEAKAVFAERLRRVEVALHNQDNREHDILDADDYFQYHGGLIAAVRALKGEAPKAYFGDTADPERPRTRSLQEEILRGYRSRVVNPKWLEAIRRHGHKGGLEMSATVDYLFGYSATAGVVPDFVWEEVAQVYALEPENQTFLKAHNPWALQAIAQRLLEAAERGLWQAQEKTLEALKEALLAGEAAAEALGEAL
ncbi:cobaltochelatase subunit CobN [Meiothermus sp. CFH 77666]|uniref:cobaltochelatase subunit CobN n=1 Tax=Meiothermus sp. CFH 77666 TaxID=2817942 RepID=UPI001AA013D4|nr:cobaltochelatase subunit CobN [Meiothermus sp. CFH 77666]MBO1437341.1 cobaltochelatase subunit CobN [Meiothermus sp. CFH 77666]